MVRAENVLSHLGWCKDFDFYSEWDRWEATGVAWLNICLKRITLSAVLKIDRKGVNRRGKSTRRLKKYTKIMIMAYASVLVVEMVQNSQILNIF